MLSNRLIRRFFFLVILLLSILLSFPVLGQEEVEEEEDEEEIIGERPTLEVGVVNNPHEEFKLDGILSEPIWETVEGIENLITVEPEEGGDPEAPTTIKVFANHSEIFLGIRCYDKNPEEIVSFSKARDSPIMGDDETDPEDYVVIVFDTFLDGRSGYVFAVNPDGARFDGLVIEQGDDVNSDWDAIWEARTSRDNIGWSTEIRIPIKSLAFKKNLDTWGFNVQRRVQRLQETSRWSGASQDFEVMQTSRSGLLTNLPEFDFGIGLSISPATVGTAGKVSGEDTEYDGDLSLDVTQRLGPNLSSALTVNTDFAETEVDIRQVNLTRFPLFFPEKRTFFLEGADIFQFGAGLDEDNLLPFFSRRIGLIGRGEDDLAEIPIDVGGKVNGRVGNTNIGALIVNTRRVDSLDIGDVDEDIKIHVPDATMGVVRLSQNILEESSVGMLATFGDQLNLSNSWSAGLDFTYRTSNFMNEKNFLVGVWGVRNDREDLEGDKSAYGVTVNYPNDLLDINFKSIRIGDGFDPSLAFVPRNDIHIWDMGVEFSPRPAWPWVRQITHELAYTLYNNLDNSDWESYEATIKPIDWLLESGDSFEASVLRQGDKPPEAFEVASDVDIPSSSFSGSYEWTRYALGARLAGKRRIGGAILWEIGDYYNGDLSTIEASLAVKPSSLLTVEFTMERNTGKMMALPEDVDEEDAEELVEIDFKEEAYGIRLLLNLSPNLQVSSLTQYDTEGKELGSNTRLRWTFDPLGDLFIVYNHNILRNDEDKWEFVSNELPIKIQYSWRF